MNIFIHKGGTQQGPFSIDQVKTMLSSGLLLTSDYAWHDGRAGWERIHNLPILVSGLIPPLPTPHSLNNNAHTQTNKPLFVSNKCDNNLFRQMKLKWLKSPIVERAIIGSIASLFMLLAICHSIYAIAVAFCFIIVSVLLFAIRVYIDSNRNATSIISQTEDNESSPVSNEHSKQICVYDVVVCVQIIFLILYGSYLLWNVFDTVKQTASEIGWK